MSRRARRVAIAGTGEVVQLTLEAAATATVQAEAGGRRQTCTDHCGTCGRHFHGLTAFDSHRRAFECLDPATAVSERGRQLLQVWTEDGWCDLDRRCWHGGERVPLHPVTIWQQWGDPARFAGARSQWGTSRSGETGGAGGLVQPAPSGPSTAQGTGGVA